jgi:hypothetical protein
MRQLQIVIDFQNDVIVWDNDKIPMLSPQEMAEMGRRPPQIRDALFNRYLLSLTDLNDDAQAVSEIQAAHYEKVSIPNVIDKCKHLNDDQRTDLTELLSNYTKLLSGKLGHYLHETVHIKIDKDAKPVHKRHYPVPRIHEQTFKDELDQLVEIGVLE